MAAKKWFGLAAVVAAVGAGVAYVVTKVKQSPDKAAEIYDSVKEKAKETPEKAAALYDAAKERVQRNGAGEEPAEGDEVVERETAAT